MQSQDETNCSGPAALCTVDKPLPIMVSCDVGRQRRGEEDGFADVFQPGVDGVGQGVDGGRLAVAGHDDGPRALAVRLLAGEVGGDGLDPLGRRFGQGGGRGRFADVQRDACSKE